MKEQSQLTSQQVEPHPPLPGSQMLTVREIASRLRLSQSKVYALLAQQRLAHYRLDGAIRVSEEQLMAYLEGCLAGPPAQSEQRRVLKHVKLKHIKL